MQQTVVCIRGSVLAVRQWSLYVVSAGIYMRSPARTVHRHEPGFAGTGLMHQHARPISLTYMLYRVKIKDRVRINVEDKQEYLRPYYII